MGSAKWEGGLGRGLTFGDAAGVCLNCLQIIRGVSMRVRSRRGRAGGMLACAFGLVLALSACTATPTTVAIDLPEQVDAALAADTATQLEDAVTSAIWASGASGAVVGVWAPWSGTWVKGLGTQAHGSSKPVEADASFRAGRITRAMTCDVLYAVAAEGTLSIDDTVPTWVSGVPDLKDVTLEELCDGTSGTGSYSGQLFSQWLSNPDREWNPNELAAYGLGQPRTTLPGEAWRDSDAGYVLLGLALERATGETASALLKKYVFDRLELTSTYLPSAVAAPPAESGAVLRGFHSSLISEGVADCAEPLDITTLSSSIGFTDSGVVSTIADLGRYAQALAAGALNPKGVDRFANPMPAYEGAPSWYTTDGGAFQAGSMIGQYGGVPGYISAAFADPTTGLTVAVVLNNSVRDASVAEALAWELAAIASKAPAAAGNTAPEAGLPWTAEQYHTSIAASSVCPAPAS